MSAQIKPLKVHQTAVTRLPRLLTELPFFYLTKKAAALREPIDFHSNDRQGRPIIWKVNPNFGERIGPPSLLAHEVWVRLIKPRIDEERKSCGFIPSLIPLGGVRQCLRILGWSYGGHQAHSLIRAINQIGGAWCEANLWLPTRESSENSEPIFRAFHANFSRLSLYAIGSNHLTEEDLKQGRIDLSFNLDDILYIKLDPIEMRMLDAETDRPIDNEYLFSLSPSGRRWYELMASKFYGVISNEGRGRGYCEIRYSWYVERHHTLKQHAARKRKVQQMNEVIHEHLEMGFIQKVEYESVKGLGEGKCGEDVVIRYYPGKFAVRVTQRISSKGLTPRDHSRRVRGVVSVPSEKVDADDRRLRLEKELMSFGVAGSRARRLVENDSTVVERQLLALPLRAKEGIRDIGAWLVRAIESDFELPESLSRAIESGKAKRDASRKEESDQARDAHEHRFREDYSRYLQQRTKEIQKERPDQYLLFLEATADERHKNEKLIESPVIRQILFEKLLSDFFGTHPEQPILSFWDWDAALNPHPIGSH